MRTLLLMAAVSQLLVSTSEDKAREVAADLQKRSFENVTRRFNATMAKSLQISDLASVWNALQGQVGAYQRVRSAKVEAKGGFDIVTLTTAFEKADINIVVSFDREGRIGGLFFKPAGAPPNWVAPAYGQAAALEESYVDVAGLPGTLALPHGKGPFPVVIFIHGSGPNDRDESIGPNKLFKDLAWTLAGKGVASLRYDKRTLVRPEEFERGRRYTAKEEVLDDAKAAVDALMKAPKIDRRKIVIIGHSLGGTLAPRIAAADARIAGAIIMAGATRQLDELARDQLLVAAPGNISMSDNVEAFSKQMRDPNLSPDAEVDFMGTPLPGSYLIDLRTYDPVATAAKLTVPLLIVQGQRDYQVTMKDFATWKSGLQPKKKNVTYTEYPTLNHLFLEGAVASTPAEYKLPGHCPEAVADSFVKWIRELKESGSK